MGYYAYKDVANRDDFQALIPEWERDCNDGEDFDGTAGYDGQCWHVASLLLTKKADRVEQLEAEGKSLRGALDARDMFLNPDTLKLAADEIDCCGGNAHRCDNAWHEWDTNASGCHASERGEYCPNDVAETLRALAEVAEKAALEGLDKAEKPE